MNKEKINIGLYLRKSSGKEDNINLQYQREVGIKFCNENGYDYEVYSEVVSGGNLDRGEFNKMIEGCEDGKLDGVWVFKYDRMDRNLESMVLLRNICVKYGIKFWVGNEEFNLNDSNDRLNIGFRSLIAEDERFRIRDRVVRGKKFKLRDGKYILGKMRYGYDVNKGVISINIEKSKIIKWIYKIFLYKSVVSYSGVEVRLNNRVGKGNKVLGVNKIREILQNSLYSDGFVKMNFDKEEFKFDLDRIISEEDNGLVKEKIIRLNSLRKRKSSEDDFLLKGKIYCNCCKNIMWVIGSNKKKYYRYYSCSVEVNKINLTNNYSNKEIKVDCNSILRNKINLVKVEEIVWDCLFEVLLNSNNILSQYKKKYSEGRVNEKNYLSKIKFYEDKKDKINKKFRDELSKFDLIGDLELLVKDVKKEYQDNILEIDKNINELKEYINNLELLSNDELIERKIKDDMMLIHGNKRMKDKKRFLDKYVDSVYVERKSEGRKELVYDIDIKFKIDISYMKNIIENNVNVKNNNGVGSESIYKLKNADINQNTLVYKSFKKSIKITLLVNVLLFKNIEKNYGISYLKSKIFY